MRAIVTEILTVRVIGTFKLIPHGGEGFVRFFNPLQSKQQIGAIHAARSLQRPNLRDLIQ